MTILLPVALWVAAMSAAQDVPYRERQVLDPNAGGWIDESPPTTTAPADPVSQAREMLARNQPDPAMAILKPWLAQNPEDPQYYDALLLLGDCYAQRRDYWNAAERYQEVAENTGGDLFHLAQSRCVDVGRAFLAGEKRILWGILRLPAYDDGADLLDRVWQRAPGSRLGEFALKQTADFHFGRGEMGIASDEYNNLAQNYPSGRYIQVAMLRSAEAAEASFPGIKHDDQKLVDADERYRRFEETFPAYAAREQIGVRRDGIRETRASKDLDVARWYERTRARDAAVYYYKRVLSDWPETLAAGESRAALKALGVAVDGDGPDGAPLGPRRAAPSTRPAAPKELSE